MKTKQFAISIIAACSLSVTSLGFAQSPDQGPLHKVMEESHQKSMAMKMTGNIDHDFAMMMRGHHETGVAMAKVQVEQGKDKAMVAMAKKIIAAQEKEIKQFDKWMASHSKK